jgi:DNA-binding CsgD family transcriptional regulator
LTTSWPRSERCAVHPASSLGPCAAAADVSLHPLELQLVALGRAGEHSSAELSDLFGDGRSTVSRAISRDQRD